jgi:thiol:disulfide interchange protein
MRWLALVLALVACHEPPRAIWANTEAEAFERARAEHTGVMIESYATWSNSSRELDRLLHDPAVSAALAPTFVPMRFDMSKETDADDATMARYDIATSEEVVFVRADGTVVGRITHMPNEHEVQGAIAAAAAAAKH